MNHIYLDANSTTRMDETVRTAMLDAYKSNDVNPASQHRPGQLARQKLENLRAEIAGRLGAGRGDRLIFTSGGTESDNLALIGLAAGLSAVPADPPPEVIVSAIEHPAVLGAAEFLASRGFVIKRLPVSEDGLVDVAALAELVSPHTRVVSLMLANNETGVIQNVAKAVEICREFGVPVHCDAVQGVGKIPVGFAELGLAAMTVTAHKLHGPRGVGGLLLGEDVVLQPIMFGSVQQLSQRPGTEDVALVTGFAKAIELAVDSLEIRATRMQNLRDRFEQAILAELPDTVIHGVDRSRVPHTSNLSFPGGPEIASVNRQALMMAADMAEVAISTGSACTSGSSEPSHVLTAMGCPQAVIESSIRVSLSALTTESEMIEGARRIIKCVNHLRRQKSVRK